MVTLIRPPATRLAPSTSVRATRTRITRTGGREGGREGPGLGAHHPAKQRLRNALSGRAVWADETLCRAPNTPEACDRDCRCQAPSRGGSTTHAATPRCGRSAPVRNAGTPRRAGWLAGSRNRRDGVRGRARRARRALCGGQREQKSFPRTGPRRGCWGKEGSSRTLPFLEPSQLPVEGSPRSAAPAKAGNSAMSQLTTTATCPNCPRSGGQYGAAPPSIPGAVVRPADLPKWRRRPVAAEGRRA